MTMLFLVNNFANYSIFCYNGLGDKMNGVIIVNKPQQYTSHDVIQVLRKTLHTKKVGHCGTLDPDATGVLVVCVNKATKLVPFLTCDDKEYIATLTLGFSTDTYDASGTVVDSKPFTKIAKDIETVLQSYIGTHLQKPPIYSAIKVNGKKLYEYARNNDSVEIPERKIEIYKIDLLHAQGNQIQFKVHCQKGTYIRTLCHDIAKDLGYPGHMSQLERTKSGSFTIAQSYSLDQIAKGEFSFLSIEEALQGYPQYILEKEEDIYHGKQIVSDRQEEVVVYNTSGKALAVYGPGPKGYLKNIRGLW